MTFKIKDLNETAVTLARRIGYRPVGVDNDEYSLVRPITGKNYPRFHIYVKRQDNEFTFNLHLDQKTSSYLGSSAHSGEYEGELVEREAQRIINIVRHS